MKYLYSMLLAGDEDIGKIIFGVIAAVIWIVSALASNIQKQKNKGGRILPPPGVRPAPVSQWQQRAPKQPSRRTPSPPRAPSALQAQIARATQALERLAPPANKRVLGKKAPARRLAPPLPPAAQLEEVPSPPPPPLPMKRQREINASSPAVNAAILHQWARPKNLRTQFILTEIFQPPVALRDRHLPQ